MTGLYDYVLCYISWQQCWQRAAAVWTCSLLCRCVELSLCPYISSTLREWWSLSVDDVGPPPLAVILAPNSRSCSSRERLFFKSGSVPAVVDGGVRCWNDGEAATGDVDRVMSPLMCDQLLLLLLLTGCVCSASSCCVQTITRLLKSR